MTDVHVALFLHILGVIALASGIAVAGVAHGRARRSDGVETVLVLLWLARTGVLIAAPAALLIVGAGIWLASIEHLGWNTGWLRDAVGLFVVSVVLGALGGRRPRQARELAERVLASGHGSDGSGAREHAEPRALLDDRVAQIANVASVIAMLGVLWLMIAKP